MIWMAETNERIIKHGCGCVHKIGKTYINLDPCPQHKAKMVEFNELLNKIGHGYDSNAV